MKIRKIGILLGSFKPFQKGHEKVLIESKKYSSETIILISNKERDSFKIENFLYEYTLLKEKYNIVLEFKENPVKDLFDLLLSNPSNIKYRIYLGKDRIDLKKSLKKKFKNISISLIERNEYDISGTKMRKWLLNNNKYSFLKNLPSIFSSKEKEEIWNKIQETRIS